MVSGIKPYDRATWILEVVPVIIIIPLLIATYKRFPLSNSAYILIAVHSGILILGGHYSYARVPVGNWVQDLLDLNRNHYDRLGHFVQGFVPAFVAREILIRTSPIKGGRWAYFLPVAIALAVSAFYEMIEWWVAIAAGASSESFLGTQGDVWDTQWDMFMALIGASLAMTLPVRWHGKGVGKFRGKD